MFLISFDDAKYWNSHAFFAKILWLFCVRVRFVVAIVSIHLAIHTTTAIQLSQRKMKWNGILRSFLWTSFLWSSNDIFPFFLSLYAISRWGGGSFGNRNLFIELFHLWCQLEQSIFLFQFINPVSNFCFFLFFLFLCRKSMVKAIFFN